LQFHGNTIGPDKDTFSLRDLGISDNDEVSIVGGVQYIEPTITIFQCGVKLVDKTITQRSRHITVRDLLKEFGLTQSAVLFGTRRLIDSQKLDLLIPVTDNDVIDIVPIRPTPELLADVTDPVDHLVNAFCYFWHAKLQFDASCSPVPRKTSEKSIEAIGNSPNPELVNLLAEFAHWFQKAEEQRTFS
jgi:hypothetical protein